MIESIKICFYKYANFSGTAKRAEFWWFFLFSIVTQIITWIIFGDTSVITFYITAILALPEVSVASRRLRDINKSGWWQLLVITIVGIIPLLVWYSRKSEKQRSKEINSSFEKLVPFLELAKEGINNWKSWTLGIITIFFFWVILGSFVVEIFLPEVSIYNSEIQQIFAYIVSNWVFVIGLIGILISARIFHKKRLSRFITSRKNIDYDKIFLAIIIGLIFMTYEIFILDPTAFENIIFNSPSIEIFILLLLFVIVLTPIQCAFEEILFRGYLLQGLSLKIKNIFILCFINGTIFMLPHLGNPEPWEYGLSGYIFQMILIGAFYSFIVIKDNGSEITIGLHAINNMFIFLILSTEVSAIGTPSLFVSKEASFDYGFSEIFYSIFSITMLYIIFSTKYGWDKNIFDRFLPEAEK